MKCSKIKINNFIWTFCFNRRGTKNSFAILFHLISSVRVTWFTMETFPLFLDALSEWTDLDGSKVIYSFLDDQGNVQNRYSYSDLSKQSEKIAKHLLDSGLKPGDRALLVYPPSLDFIVAFIACLKAGIIAVPTFPPDPNKLNKDLKMFSVIADSCGSNTALTSSMYNYATKVAAIKSLFSTSGARWPDLNWIVTDRLSEPAVSSPVLTPFPTITNENIAFLQYTSGSTSEPKGVMITHGNLSHNLSLIIKGLSADTSTVVVGWLPQYHDMGLIGSYLGAAYCGGSGFYMSPFSFIRNPPLWIKCISGKIYTLLYDLNLS